MGGGGREGIGYFPGGNSIVIFPVGNSSNGKS